jgi:hypothetical protein
MDTAILSEAANVCYGIDIRAPLVPSVNIMAAEMNNKAATCTSLKSVFR